MNPNLKKCSGCRMLKDLNLFGRRRENPHGNTYCKFCVAESTAESTRRRKGKPRHRPEKRKDTLWLIHQAIKPLQKEIVNCPLSWRCILDVESIGTGKLSKAEIWCLVFEGGIKGIFTVIEGMLEPIVSDELLNAAKRFIARGYRLPPEINSEIKPIPELNLIGFDFRNHGVQLFYKEIKKQ